MNLLFSRNCFLTFNHYKGAVHPWSYLVLGAFLPPSKHSKISQIIAQAKKLPQTFCKTSAWYLYKIKMILQKSGWQKILKVDLTRKTLKSDHFEFIGDTDLIILQWLHKIKVNNWRHHLLTSSELQKWPKCSIIVMLSSL